MASIRERHTKTGSPYFSVLYRHDGKQASRTFPTRKGAQNYLALVNALGPVAADAALERAPVDVPAVTAYVNAYVNALSGITEGTRSDYLSYARRDLTGFAALPVTALTREAVAKWVNDLAGRLSGKSIKNRHSLLSAAMARAVLDGYIAENPCHGVRLPRTIRREMTFLTHSEFAQLIGHIPAYWRPFVMTLAGTGMRWGEATALTIRDVDLDATPAMIRVRQAWKHTDGKGRELGPPKTSKGLRSVSIGPEIVSDLIPLLESERKDTGTARMRRPAPDDLVYVNRQGRPVSQSTFLVHVWQPAVRAFAGDVAGEGRTWTAGPGKRPRVHDLRHTHAAWLIAARVPLPVIQQRLGHESIQTTVDVYGHLMPDAHEVSARAASVALSQASPTVEDPLAIEGSPPPGPA